MRPALALVVAAVALSGCHHDPPPRLLQQTVGRGAVATTILREPGLRAPAPVVLFLHGWGATTPSYYRPWLEHLAREGNVVLYPRYQDAIVTPPQEALGNVLAGVGLALRHADVDPRSLVVA